MALGRIGEAMLPVALVLSALRLFDSPPLAGALSALLVFPGLIASPVVGAMLDRFGRVRLILLDYVVALSLTALMTVLFLGSRPGEAILLGLTLILGVTQMFSDAGVRSLFMDTVPDHLWERVNAVDSTGYQVAWICGPSVAAILFSIGGAPITFVSIAVVFGLAIVSMRGVHETPRSTSEAVDILRLTRLGISYVLRNRALRGLAACVGVTNVCFGLVLILVPIIVVDALAADEGFVGVAFAISGIMGMLGAVLFGRLDSHGRERVMVYAPAAGMTLSTALLLPAVSGGEPTIALAWVFATMVFFGFSSGSWDIGIFTLRQRRTDPAMVGRAFAISMALNQSGYPLGAALGGWIAATSIETAVVAAMVFGTIGTVLGFVLLPRDAGAPGA
jgi:MFS family permease